MAFDQEKFKEIFKERGIDAFIADPKKMLDECGLVITDEQYITDQLKEKVAPTEEDVLSVICAI